MLDRQGGTTVAKVPGGQPRSHKLPFGEWWSTKIIPKTNFGTNWKSNLLPAERLGWAIGPSADWIRTGGGGGGG